MWKTFVHCVDDNVNYSFHAIEMCDISSNMQKKKLCLSSTFYMNMVAHTKEPETVFNLSVTTIIFLPLLYISPKSENGAKSKSQKLQKIIFRIQR